MNFEEALRDELSKISGFNNKVFPLNASEGTETPFIVYVSSEGIHDKTLQGYLISKEVECEINILHDSYSSNKTNTKLVLEKVLSFQNRVIGQDGPFIQNLTYEKPVEIYEKDVELYRSIIEIVVNF